MKDYRNTPLWDGRLPVRERIDYLLEEMTIDEKLRFLAAETPELERLGIGKFFIGGEAAHGVEARHDQDEIGQAEPTTSFPQPIGMSATWDPELIREAGRVTGIEARALYRRHPERGLFRWAPTVDMERDPRWGRTEEGYGEDPYLTGIMASAYVRGMQGDDPEHLLISAALKHFEANNVEDGRGVKSSTLDARNRYDYYDEPFRRVIEESGVTSLMTAYNKVNGVPCILDRRVNEVVRGRWGFDGHVVCDVGSLSMAMDEHRATASHAESIAAALKAGVDCMTDEPEVVERAAREAFARGLITEEEIDRALRHSFGSKLRLGLYDAYGRNPWNCVPEEAPDSPEHRRISLKTAEEAVVLLKNDGLLPLSPETNIAVVGPLGDRWYQDWYGGEPVYRTTVLDGVRSVTGRETEFDDGLARILLCCGEGLYAALDEEGMLVVTADREKAEIFSLQDWGSNSVPCYVPRLRRIIPQAWDEHSVTFYVPRLRRYLSVHDDGGIAADKETIFGWFVKECFYWRGEQLAAWDGALICAEGERLIAARPVEEPESFAEDTGIAAERPGRFTEDIGIAAERPGRPAEDTESVPEQLPVSFTAIITEDGAARAAAVAKQCETAVLVLGCCPVINGKETTDRASIQLPPAQRALAQAVYEANPRTVLVLLANYPYAIDWEQEHLPTILLSASGSQDMGIAVARTLFGQNAPAGRLNMTWYSEHAEMPDINDYDIMKTNRTYRYYRGAPLYPFGHGLTYGAFRYTGLTVAELLPEPGNNSTATENKAAAGVEPESGQKTAVDMEAGSRKNAGEVPVWQMAADETAAGSVCAEGSCAQAESGGMSGGLRASLSITNVGAMTSDEVVQIYVRMPHGRVRKPLRQLIGFQRVHDVTPGESRELCFEIPRRELRYYDVASGAFLVEEGIYIIEAGASSGDIRLQKDIFLSGAKPGSRKAGIFISADHWDDYYNVKLEQGPGGFDSGCASAVRRNGNFTSWIIYDDCEDIRTGARLLLRLRADGESLIKVCRGNDVIASWCGKTDGFEDIELMCDSVSEDLDGELIFYLGWGVSMAGFCMVKEEDYPATGDS